MNCPVCDRKLAPTLSICPACGAMMNDSVREELQHKIVALRDRPIKMSFVDDETEMAAAKSVTNAAEQPNATMANAATAHASVRMSVGSVAVGAGNSYSVGSYDAGSPQTTETLPEPKAVEPPAKRPIETSELRSAKTSPTLVGFQNRNATEPDWKIQLRSAVQKRRGIVTEMPTARPAVEQPIAEKANATNAKPAIDLETITAKAAVDPRVAKALERIERSKQKVAAESKHKTPSPPLKFRPAAFDARPVAVSSRIDSLPIIEKRSNVTPIAPVAGRFDVDMPVIKPTAFRPPLEPDTNKLPPIADIVPPVEEDLLDDDSPITMQEERIVIDAIDLDDDIADEALDDLAPLATRIAAGAFDVIIALAGTGFALLPLIILGLDVTTTVGVFVSLTMFALTTFLYSTVSIAFFDRTAGMRLFGLELVDAEENEPPTLKQSAIYSALFLASLMTAGLGFATLLINPERRAFHDIVSGTILVREF